MRFARKVCAQRAQPYLMPRSPLQPGLQKASFLTDCRHDWPAAFRVDLSIQQNRAVRWCRSRSASLLPSHARLSELCDQASALALFGYCVPQRIWCATHKSENPGDVVNSNLNLRPLEVQPSLGGTNECLSFSVTHEPVPPLPMPTCSWTYLTPETNENRVPGESNGWHSQGPVRQSQAPRPRSIVGCPRLSRSAVPPGLLTDGGTAAGDQQQPDDASHRSNQLVTAGQVLDLDRLL